MEFLNEIKEKYKDFDFTKEYNSRILNSKRKEYSRGGLAYNLGIYELSIVDHLIIDNSRGKIIKNPRKTSDFTYYFDENDKLSLITKGDFSVSFFIYESNTTRVLTFEGLKSTPEIVVYFESIYDEFSRMVYYIEIHSVIIRELFFSYDTLDTINVEEKISISDSPNPPRIRKYSFPMSDVLKFNHK